MNDPEWEVIRIDNNPDLAHVENLRVINLLNWADFADLLGMFDLVTFSPPCVGFSTAYNAPRSRAQRAGEEYEPDFSILQAGLDCIEAVLKPGGHYVVENVSGASMLFRPFLGNPVQQVGPFFLWGRYPYLVMKRGFKHFKSVRDPQLRALVPIEISLALKEGIETQWSLTRFC